MKKLLLPVLVLSSSSYADVLRLECSGELTVHPGVWYEGEWPKPRSRESDDAFYDSLTKISQGAIRLAIDVDSGDAQYATQCEDISKCPDNGFQVPNSWSDFKEKVEIKPNTFSVRYEDCTLCFDDGDWVNQYPVAVELALDRLTGDVDFSIVYEQRYLENYDCLSKNLNTF